MQSAGQGAIEYLLIIGAAILVVAIVILAVTGVLSGGQGQVGTSAGEYTGGVDVLEEKMGNTVVKQGELITLISTDRDELAKVAAQAAPSTTPVITGPIGGSYSVTITAEQRVVIPSTSPVDECVPDTNTCDAVGGKNRCGTLANNCGTATDCNQCAMGTTCVADTNTCETTIACTNNTQCFYLGGTVVSAGCYWRTMKCQDCGAGSCSSNPQWTYQSLCYRNGETNSKEEKCTNGAWVSKLGPACSTSGDCMSVMDMSIVHGGCYWKTKTCEDCGAGACDYTTVLGKRFCYKNGEINSTSTKKCVNGSWTPW
jgi:hypothetical protein